MQCMTCFRFGNTPRYIEALKVENQKLTAIAIAILLSVTVSMGLLTRGVLRVMFFVRGLLRATSVEAKSM